MSEEKKTTSNSSVIRVHKTKNFTIICNEALFEKPPLSLEAKGLLCFMLALPEDWNYSIDGLVAICKEGRYSVKSTLKELKERGYLQIEKIPPNKSKTGRFEYIYHIYESKQNVEKQEVENQPLEIQSAELQTAELQTADFQAADGQELENQPNNKELKNKELKTNGLKKETTKNPDKEKNSFGEFENVFLTKKEEEKLLTLYKGTEKFNVAIEILSSYKASSGKKYKSDYAVLNKSNWVYPKVFPNESKPASNVVSITPATGGGKYSTCYK